MALCQLCLSLDLAAISREGGTTQFSLHEEFPVGHELYCYRADDVGVHHPFNNLTRYHSSLESLRDSSRACELCSLVNKSVGRVLGNMEAAKEHDIDYPISDYEFWIHPFEDTDGFIVFGYHQNWNPGLPTHKPTYILFAGVGLCVESGECSITYECLSS
jgi:hypothetical protein